MFTAESMSWAPPKQGSRWSPTSFRMTSLGTAARPGCQTTWEWIKIWLTQEATDLNIFLIEKSIYLLRYQILIHTHVAFGILKIPFRFLDSKPFLGFQERTFHCINCLFLDPSSGWFESESPCQTLDNFACNPQQLWIIYHVVEKLISWLRLAP